jgi:hypothetical protein
VQFVQFRETSNVASGHENEWESIGAGQVLEIHLKLLHPSMKTLYLCNKTKAHNIPHFRRDPNSEHERQDKIEQLAVLRVDKG